MKADIGPNGMKGFLDDIKKHMDFEINTLQETASTQIFLAADQMDNVSRKVIFLK